MAADEILVSAFEDGRPCVLFLGQDAWTTAGRSDRVLSLWLSHLGRPPMERPSWRDVLGAAPLSEDAYAWLAERFARNVVPDEITDALDLPWSAIFTSSIDATLIRRLQTLGRTPEAIRSKEHIPQAPRSMTNPPVFFLFGTPEGTRDGTRCPRNDVQRRQRQAQHGAPMLQRLEETATPLGVLVIDGFEAGRDWLAFDELFSGLPADSGMQMILCGADSVPPDSIAETLVSTGSLILEKRRLAEWVLDLSARDRLTSAARHRREALPVVTLANDQIMEVSPALRLRVEASASIVDDEWTQSPTPLPNAATEEAFHRFHGEFGGPRMIVEGVARGFAIERPFERGLQDHLRTLLTRKRDVDRIVLLHGQSGTGKSVALGRATHMFRREHCVPVLFATGRVPDPIDIDAFCAEAEHQGAAATLVLCDANASVQGYRRLADALQSRGRRAVVVGTSYRVEASHAKSVIHVEAPAAISPQERGAIVALVSRYAHLQSSELDVFRNVNTENVFALLYRVLTASRARLVSGISAEARAAEDSLRHRRRHPRTHRLASKLAEQLIAAGLHNGEMPAFAGSAEEETFGTDAAGKLIDYVMAAGRLDVYVPLSLLMRVLRARIENLEFADIAEVLRDLDLFRWRKDESGAEQLVGPRLRLEAELICRRRLADSRRELACLVDLIGAVRATSLDRSSELRFLFDLLSQVDDKGPRGSAYASGYLQIARALTELRTVHGVDEASVVLQESNFRRAWLRCGRSDTTIPAEERDGVLDEARQVVDDAIARTKAEPSWASPRTRQDFFVERAAIYGFLAVGHAAGGGTAAEVWSDYQAARTAARRAMSAAPNYYPFDVALWMPVDVLDRAVGLSEEQRAEVLADVYSVLDQVDARSLPVAQQEVFDKRRHRVGKALNDQALVKSVLDSIKKSNPALALFLETRTLAAALFDRKTAGTAAELQRAATAARASLRSAASKEVAEGDLRTLRLWLELEWVAATGERLLRGERRPLPDSLAVRAEVSRLLGLLASVSGDVIVAPLRYLQAVLSWVEGDNRHSSELFKALERDTNFEDRNRTHRRLFIADAEQRPVRFSGRLRPGRASDQWMVDVERYGDLALLRRDFPNITLGKGLLVPQFAIAFNYRGPIADPLNRYEETP